METQSCRRVVGRLLQQYDWMGKYALRLYYVLLANSFIVCLILLWAKVRALAQLSLSRLLSVFSAGVGQQFLRYLVNEYRATGKLEPPGTLFSSNVSPLLDFICSTCLSAFIQGASAVLVLSYSMSNFL